MTPLLLAIPICVSFASALLLVPFLRKIALKRDWIDAPDDGRKEHDHPTPNIGGIAIVSGFLMGVLTLLVLGQLFSEEISLPHWAFFAGGVSMASMGVYDDIHGLSFKKKFFFQIVVAYFLLFAGFRIDVSGISFFGIDPEIHALVSIPLTMIWIVGIINAVNLLDGLDGLASGVAIIALISLATAFGLNGAGTGTISVALILIASTAAFLVFNFNPASIFMGDAGSLFLGYVLAVFSLVSTAHADPMMALLVPVVALGLPILDTGLCMVRRTIDGISPFSPDSDHIHHRLRKLWSHRGAVYILYAAAGWFGIAAILISQFNPVTGLLMVGVTIIAGIVGIRTLGYLNIRRLFERSPVVNSQLSMEFAFDSGDGASRSRQSNKAVRIQEVVHNAEISNGLDTERSADHEHLESHSGVLHQGSVEKNGSGRHSPRRLHLSDNDSSTV